jgi:peptidoglycan/xylan/chitin deacetylase (PgdA/CDA1 family)
MKIVSPLLKRVVYPTLSAAGVFRRSSARGLAVVTYHGVTPQRYEKIDAALDGNLITAEALHCQLRLLKADYNVITPGDARAWLNGRLDLPPRAVLLTCDDGLLNNLTDMLSVLQAQQLRCLFFVTGASAEETRSALWYEELYLLFLRAPEGKFDITHNGVVIDGELSSRESRRAIWWNAVKRLSQIDASVRQSFLRIVRQQLSLNPMENLKDAGDPFCRRFGLLTVSELESLAGAGMTIGAHTMSHPVLSQMPEELARAEMVECRARLESAVQTPIWAFAYPFGDAASVNAETIRFAQDASYEAAFLNIGGGLGVPLPRFTLPRVHVTSEMSLAEFDAHVSGLYAGLQRRVGRTAPSF